MRFFVYGFRVGFDILSLIMLNKTLIPLLSAIGLTATLHFIFLATDLYYTHPLVDIPVHMLGGAVIASGIFWLSSFIPAVKRPTWSQMFTIILIVGLVWEIWEILVGAVDMSDSYYAFDTVKDMIDDVVGALGVWWAYSVLGSKK